MLLILQKKDVYFHELNLNTEEFHKRADISLWATTRFISSSYRPDNEKTSSDECKEK